MQQFKTFKARRITIEKARKGDLKEYRTRLLVQHKEAKDKLNILEDSSIFYLKVKNEDGKMIGLIQINEIDQDVACVKISIPNKAWEKRYGKETIHQFIRCCKERKLYRRVYFKSDNDIVREYKKERPEMLNKNFYIDINVQ